jgi:hypothetical protein
LSFPGDEDVIPIFAPLTVFSYFDYAAGNPLIEHIETSCDDLWCNELDCVADGYPSQQRRHREKMEQKIKPILEECEKRKPEQSGATESLKEYLEQNNLLQLLPGVVPAFVLRSRKWSTATILNPSASL